MFKELPKGKKERVLKRIKRRSKRNRRSGKFLEGGIIHKYQQESYDCGQTCLDMLGYEGHLMFSARELSEEDLMEIPGVKRIFESDLGFNTSFFECPYMIHVRDFSYGMGHWILGYKDKIFCPTQGIKSNKKYKRSVVWFNRIYKVPLRKQTDSAR